MTRRDLGAAVPREERAPVIGIATLLAQWLAVALIALGAGTMLAVMLTGVA